MLSTNFVLTNPVSLYSDTTRPIISLTKATQRKQGFCWACGLEAAVWEFKKVINDELAAQWGLNSSQRQSFDGRESAHCPNCGASYRQRQMAEAIAYTTKSSSLLVATQTTLNSLAVAEINSCGSLHQFLQNINGLRYSEYGSIDQGVPSENLQSLSYATDSLDYIFTSDTLEHIPDTSAALGEIHRVLKPGGMHIFTIPIIWSRPTRHRAKMNEGGVTYLHPPSYHGEGQPDYLVFNEFGFDTIVLIKNEGFDVKVYGRNILNSNDASGVLLTTKVTKR